MYGALSHADVGVYAAPMIALYTVADSGERHVPITAGVIIVLLLAGVHALIRPSSWMGTENLTLASLCGLAVAAGDASRSRRAYSPKSRTERSARSASTSRRPAVA